MTEMLLRSGFLGRVLVMPNTKPREVMTGPEAIAYGTEIDGGLFSNEELGSFTRVMTIQITEKTTREMIRDAYACGVRVCKVYPRYVTTNSENGVVDYTKIYPALAETEALGMVVCFHGEHPSYDVPGRLKEIAFKLIIHSIRQMFPNLKIVIEHISTRFMRDWVWGQPVEFVRATITAHHLALTQDDVIGYSQRSRGLIRVHNGCKPCYKDPEDRFALQEAAVSGDPHFFYGGDDAPHLRRAAKECDGAACGVFNTTVALPYLVQLFIDLGWPEALDDFLSGHGADYYDYPRSNNFIVLDENPWVVPSEYPVQGTNDGVVPLFAGETMRFRVRA
jgi:dihydroorotase